MPEAVSLPRGIRVLERGWLSANNVILDSGDGPAAIVDTGYWTHSAQTVALVQRSLGPRDLGLVVNTHLHSDHCGGNAALRAAYPASKILIPPGQARHVANWNTEALTYAPTGQHCPAFSFDGLLRPGEEVLLADRHWQIHAAPGHDQHSVILFEPSTRTLISADALWENGFGVVFAELEGDSAFDEVAATLDLIEQLDAACVIPGHGSVFGNPRPALGRARSRLETFVQSPPRHASHAAKVLLKFKLLEMQQMGYNEMADWAQGTRYFAQVHSRYFGDLPFRAWIEEMAAQLVRSGAARREGEMLINA